MDADAGAPRLDDRDAAPGEVVTTDAGSDVGTGRVPAQVGASGAGIGTAGSAGIGTAGSAGIGTAGSAGIAAAGSARIGTAGSARIGTAGSARIGTAGSARIGTAGSAKYVVERRPSPAHRAVPRIGGARPLVALVIALGMGLAALVIALGDHGPRSAAPPAAPPAPATADAAAAAPTSTPSPAPPADLRATEVRLPTVGVRSGLVALDIGADGALQAPPDPNVAGWYVRGSVPGEPGPTVIAGHVDSRSGPAVFFRLDQLAVGDRVEVTRSDGQVFAYRVVTVERHPKNDFPTARVYGPTPGPELHLITCGGDFDHRAGHYRDNVVVTALPMT